MKLRTEVRGKDGGKYVVGAPEDHTHTELAAHALMQAMEQVLTRATREVVDQRADALLQEWTKQDEVK